MSYDIMVGDDDFNITSNLSEFFSDFGAHPKDMNGKTGEEVAAMIALAIDRIADTDLRTLECYDDPSGWGKWNHGLKFLMGVRDGCRNDKEATVEVSW